MANENPHGIPDHIAPLLEPTPSGVLKLIAAWDGLSVETQILVLSKLALPSYLAEKFLARAIESVNPYVRYLAVRKFNFTNGDGNDKKSIKQRIEKDTDLLVRYSLVETESRIFDTSITDPARFFNLPHAARLAKVRCLGGSSGENIATLISYAVDHQLKDGSVTENEIADILIDYVCKQEFKNYFFPHHFENMHALKALWRLVPKLPEWVSMILIENMPVPDDHIPDTDDVINGMTDEQLKHLFWRHDIGLEKWRKKYFYEVGEERRDVRNAATRWHFSLTDDEFNRVLAMPEDKKKSILDGLLIWSNHLDPCLYYAISDVQNEIGDDYTYQDEDVIERRLGEALRLQAEGDRKYYIHRIRLYLLARRAVPWDKSKEGDPPSSDELKFLAPYIVKGDTWATFMAFYKEGWRMGEGATQKLVETLEGYFDGSNVYEEDIKTLAQLNSQIKIYLPDALSPLASQITNNKTALDDVNNQIGLLVRAHMEDRFLLLELRATHNRLKILSYVLIAFLAWGFFIR